jgi:hypothetical protein
MNINGETNQLYSAGEVSEGKWFCQTEFEVTNVNYSFFLTIEFIKNKKAYVQEGEIIAKSEGSDAFNESLKYRILSDYITKDNMVLSTLKSFELLQVSKNTKFFPSELIDQMKIVGTKSTSTLEDITETTFKSVGNDGSIYNCEKIAN